MNSDLISLFASVIQAIASLVALALSVIAIRQTNKSLKEANKSQIIVYADFINFFGDPDEYLIIKNTGNSTATIDEITINPKGTGMSKQAGYEYFHGLEGSMMAPKQAFTYLYAMNVFSEDKTLFDPTDLTITVKYHDYLSHYEESFFINNSEVRKGFIFGSPDTSQPLNKQISKIANEWLRKKL